MKKNIIIISTFIFITMLSLVIGYQAVSANTKVNENKDIISYQKELETYFISHGYTIENPNIILNPYKISPLTALILFETDDAVEVTITVVGKDDNSTYTKTYNKEKQHCIEVYGLYPDYNNKIKLSYNNTTKIINIKTEPLPKDLTINKEEFNNNNLYFITSDKYPYAIDNNNEVRWYLKENYSKKISRLDNGNLLLSNPNKKENDISSGLVELNLLGKIYNEYNISTGYYGNYEIKDNSILVESVNEIEIDKQTGTIIKENDTTNLEKNENINKQLMPLYTDNEFKLIDGHIFNTELNTKESNDKVYLFNYKEIDNDYKKYKISISKENDSILVSGNFDKFDKIYLILDKFLGKKVYNINTNNGLTQEYIKSDSLKGKYSIYIKINDKLYKTNKYIKF